MFIILMLTYLIKLNEPELYNTSVQLKQQQQPQEEDMDLSTALLGMAIITHTCNGKFFNLPTHNSDT